MKTMPTNFPQSRFSSPVRCRLGGFWAFLTLMFLFPLSGGAFADEGKISAERLLTSENNPSAETIAEEGIKEPPESTAPNPPDDLTFLGILTESELAKTAVPNKARLVRLPTAAPADRIPGLNAGGPSENSPNSGADSLNPLSNLPAGASTAEKRYFVCRLNRLSDKESQLLNDAADGRWEQFTFLEAVLIAEGTAELKQRNALRLFQHFSGELAQKIAENHPASELERAKIVFEFLHQRVLTGPYDLNRSSASVSLTTGYYNCVSATVLYNAFAETVGLSANGLETTGHAKSRLLLSDGTLDIETTCTDWNRLPDRLVPYIQADSRINNQADSPANIQSAVQPDRRTMTASRPTGEAGPAPEGTAEGTLEQTAERTPEAVRIENSGADEVSAAESTVPDLDDLVHSTQNSAVRYHKQPVREVSPVEFVATIYYNRGVDYYQKKRLGPAIAAYLKAYEVDPGNKTVLGNLKATLNNLAIELAMQKRFADAIQLTEQGLAIDPEFQQFQANLPLYYQHWSKELRASGQTAKADEIGRRYGIPEEMPVSPSEGGPADEQPNR